MFVSIICFALGGYVLINSNFQSLLDSEAKTAYSFGDIVYYSLSNELKDTKYFLLVEDRDNKFYDLIREMAQTVNINTTNGKIRFSILKNDQSVLFSSLEEKFDKNLVSHFNSNQKGYSLKKIDKEVYIQAFRPAKFWNGDYYIETIRDVTYIFDNQKSQYETMFRLMIGMIVLAGILTAIISKFIMQQVVSLTKTTKEISAGNLGKRVEIRGDDEFTLLSENFNRMADDLEEKIHELQNEAEKREIFVADFSHELKTPLTSIIGYSDMLRSKEMDRERINLCANYIYTEGKRLETLSMRLLDLIVLKNRDIYVIPINIKELLDEIYTIVFIQLNKAEIKISMDIEPAVIKLEPELMKTVFINLIDNERKAIEVNGQIHITGKLIQDKYIITIQDNGNGMDKKELSKIKEAFYMVDKSRAREQGGAGLGLAICDQILKLHGFEIKFDSIVNFGTTVTVVMKGSKK